MVNFTTFSTYARMTLPEGVKAEGYVVWNGPNPFDPLEAVPTLRRFSCPISSGIKSATTQPLR